MRAALTRLALLPLLAGTLALAQNPSPQPAQQPEAKQPGQPVEDFKPAPSNQPGKQYPQVNSERRVRFRIVAPTQRACGCPSGAGSR